MDGLFTPADLAKLLTKLLIFAPISHDEYFMPILLETLSDDELKEYRIFSASEPLLIYFPDGLPGYGVFCSLVVFLINEHQWQVVVGSSGVSKNCMKFELPDVSGSVTVIDSFSHFEIHVNIPPPICHRVCPSIKDAVFTGIDIAAKNRGYNNAKPKPAIFCPHPSDAVSSLHVAVVKDYPWWTCTRNVDIFGEFMDKHRVWFKRQELNSVPGMKS